LSYGARLIAIGPAYRSKMLCSEVFVAGRDIDAVQADLVVDDLAALQIIDASIDTVSTTTTASFHGFAESKVRYRDVIGCALAADAMTPSSSEINTRPAKAPSSSMKDTRPVEPLKSSSVDNPQLAAVLDAVFSEPDPEHLRRTRAVVILHEGRIVAER